MYPERDSLYSERGVGGLGHYDYANSAPTPRRVSVERTPQQKQDVQNLLNDHFNRAADVQLAEDAEAQHAG